MAPTGRRRRGGRAWDGGRGAAGGGGGDGHAGRDPAAWPLSGTSVGGGGDGARLSVSARSSGGGGGTGRRRSARSRCACSSAFWNLLTGPPESAARAPDPEAVWRRGRAPAPRTRDASRP